MKIHTGYMWTVTKCCLKKSRHLRSMQHDIFMTWKDNNSTWKCRPTQSNSKIYSQRTKKKKKPKKLDVLMCWHALVIPMLERWKWEHLRGSLVSQPILNQESQVPGWDLVLQNTPEVGKWLSDKALASTIMKIVVWILKTQVKSGQA